MKSTASRIPWWCFAAATLVLLKLWLVAAQPIVAIGPAGHDDRLYLERASDVLRGHWLGHYCQFTLAKGPMYSLWIAGSFLLGVPLPWSQHLLYLAGCVAIVRALRSYLPGPKTTLATFALLWFNPMSYELPVLGRVLRQNFYTPVALLFFAALIALATRQTVSLRLRLAWGALLGFSGAALWLTREESIWAAPSALLLIGFACYISWRAGTRLRPLFAPCCAAAVCGSLVVGTICTLNLIHYGWFGSVEFRAPEFINAYGALQRVQSSYEVPYVPVTREAREHIYAESPAFAELRPFLDGELGKNWAAASSPVTGLPATDHEIAGGWFMWALRDAVIAAGHNQSAKEALAFYASIADQVNRACDETRLNAGSRRDTLVPPWRPENIRRLKNSIPDYLTYFFTLRGFNPHPAPSMGSAPVLMLFRDLTRWELAPSIEAPELDRPLQTRLDRWKIDLLQCIGTGVRWTAVTLILTGLAGWVALALRALWTRQCDYLFGVTTAMLGAATAVLLINLLVHVLSFPNRSPGAFAQAYPLLLLFASLVWIQLTLWGRLFISSPIKGPSDPE